MKVIPNFNPYCGFQFLSGRQPFPHPAGAYGIAYNSLVATSEGKLWSLGGTYDNSRDMTQIYELDCSADIGAKYLVFSPRVPSKVLLSLYIF